MRTLRQLFRWLRTMWLRPLPAGKRAWLAGAANSINRTTLG